MLQNQVPEVVMVMGMMVMTTMVLIFMMMGNSPNLHTMRLHLPIHSK